MEKRSRPLLFSPKPVLRATSRLKPFTHQPAPSRSLSRNLLESSRVPTMPRVRSSKTRSTRMSEETYARNAAWRTCRKLRKVSTLFKSAKIAKVKDIEDVIFRALSSRLQSHSSIVTHSKHVDSFLRFCARRNTKEPFTGPHSCFIIHDFLDSLKARGSSLPFDARYALKVFADSLEIDWPLESRVVLSTLKKLREKPESAPSFSADTVKRIDSVITDESAPEAKKIFASSVLWPTHASPIWRSQKRLRHRNLRRNHIRNRLHV